MSTFGPAYDEAIDGGRITGQIKRILDVMLVTGFWLSLAELAASTHFPESSISADLRHLRKPRFGGWIVEKRRRNGQGTWEYRVLPPPPEGQMRLC